MKADPIIVTITFTTERDANRFCNTWHYDYMPAIRDAREVVRAELKRRRGLKRASRVAREILEGKPK